MGKPLESETLRQQAANNSKQQSATSPDLNTELLNANERLRSAGRQLT